VKNPRQMVLKILLPLLVRFLSAVSDMLPNPKTPDPAGAKAAISEAAKDLLNHRWNSAARFSKLALKADPSQSEAHRMLGAAYAGMGDLAKAGEVMKEAVRIFPQSALLHAFLADLERRLDHYELAEESYRRVLEIEPPYEERSHILLNLAQAVLLQGKFDEAEHMLRSILASDPSSTIGYHNLILLLEGLERRDEALQQAAILRELAPDDDTIQAFLQRLQVRLMEAHSAS